MQGRVFRTRVAGDVAEGVRRDIEGRLATGGIERRGGLFRHRDGHVEKGVLAGSLGQLWKRFG